MLATTMMTRYLWPTSMSLFIFGRVVTKIGYNQTRVCWRTACPFGASDSVSLSPHRYPLPQYQLFPPASLQPPPAVSTDCPLIRLSPRHYSRIVIFVPSTPEPDLRISL